MLYGIVNIICIVWLWWLAWRIGRGTSEHSIGYFWKCFCIACASSGGVKFFGALLSDSRTPIEAALLDGLLSGLVGMLVVGLAVAAVAWCIAQPFRTPIANPSQPAQDLTSPNVLGRSNSDSSLTWKLVGAFVLGTCLMAIVYIYMEHRQPRGGTAKMRELTELLDLLREDIHNNAIPADVQRWIAWGGALNSADANSKLWLDALTGGIARAAVAAHHREPTAEDETAWLRSDRNPAYPETRALLADYIVTLDPRSWDAFVRRVTESDAQYKARISN
jgi:hypothetical protein